MANSLTAVLVVITLTITFSPLIKNGVSAWEIYVEEHIETVISEDDLSTNTSKPVIIPMNMQSFGTPFKQTKQPKQTFPEELVFIEYHVYSELSVKIVYASAYLDAKKVQDDASKKFKNPSVHFLLDAQGLSTQMATTVIPGQVAHAKSKGLRKFGVSLHINDCVNKNVLLKDWDFVWAKVDFILFNAKPKDNMFTCGPETTVGCIRGKIEKCQRQIAKMRLKLDILYETSGPSKVNRDSEALYKALGNWTISHNITVLVFENGVQGSNNTATKDAQIYWDSGKNWRTDQDAYRYELPQNISGSSTKEATSNVTKMYTCLPPRSPEVDTGASISFNRAIVGVRFNPVITMEDTVSEYDAKDLKPFLNLIGTKFSNILTPAIRQDHVAGYWSNIHVAAAAAKINQKNGQSVQPTLQVFMEVDLDIDNKYAPPGRGGNPSHYASAKELADAANSIFKGTVPYLLLNAQALTSSNANLMQSRVDAAIKTNKEGNKFKYDMGVILNIRHCREIENGQYGTHNHVIRLLQKFTFVLFREETKNMYQNIDANEYFGNISSVFDDCVDIVKDQEGTHLHNLDVGFHTGWSDTDIRHRNNVTSLVLFWKHLQDFAVKMNVRVFLDSAFDEPQDPINKHTGWWKFVDNRPCYGSTEEFNFLEKMMGMDPLHETHESMRDSHEKGVVVIAYGYEVDFDEGLKENPKVENGLHRLFSWSHFGVLLRPYILREPGKGNYTKKGIKATLRKVRTRFSRVMMTSVNVETYLEPGSHVPLGAAKLNNKIRQRSAGDGNDLLHSLNKPLRVSIPFGVVDQGMYDNEWQVAFKIAKTLGDEANALSPETVEYLLIDLQHVVSDPSRWDAVKREVGRFEEEVRENQRSFNVSAYKLGAIIDSAACNGSLYLWGEMENDLLPRVQSVLLSYQSYPEEVITAQSATVQQIITEFESCRKKVNGPFPNVTVGLYVQWKEGKESFENNCASLISFWREMNVYSRESKTSVFLAEAFDNGRDAIRGGWWRVANISGNYVVQEKYQVVFNSTAFRFFDRIPIVAIPAAVTIFMTIIVLIAVGFFIRKRRHEVAAALLRLTEEDIREFFEGEKNLEKGDLENPEMDRENGYSDYERMAALVDRSEYDHSLEVAEKEFTFDETVKLVPGVYGQVYEGRMQPSGKKIEVAVKVTNSARPSEGSLAYLKNVMSEIKLLSYVGRHEHIVALLGAHTSNLSQGKVYAFLELCPYGSLEKCLKNFRKADNRKINDGYVYLPEEACEANALAKWSLDIARGMEYLASKDVVHGDLATRNVLLDANRKAKICDFELSARIMKYPGDMNIQLDSLPWRWMSPESLRLLVFNEKTDVWAFGVTLWEIYTLCEVPYASISWNADFAYLIEDGLRLSVPGHDDRHIFGKGDLYSVMFFCWEIDPEKRPTFHQLKNMLTDEVVRKKMPSKDTNPASV